jgi:FkbM family methyltransferase
VLRDPKMLRSYAAWSLGGREIRLQDGSKVAGFRHFSEFWGVLNGLPTASEQALMRRCLATGGVALDVGSNIGIFALAMAGVHRGVTVHAFEPVVSNFARLAGNVERNHATNVRLHQLAVASTNGYVKLTSDDRSPATNRISNEASAALVRCATLDDYCESCGISHVDLLKIDVEGAEPLVLAGAHSLLANRKIGTILLEICPENLVPFGFSVEDLLRPFTAAGYEMHRLAADGELGESLDEDDLRKIRLENVLVIPPIR